MRLPGTIVRTAVAVAAVTSFAVVAPAAQASPAAQAAGPVPISAAGLGVTEAPTGKQCGAYRHNYNETGGAHLRYYHCGGTRVKIEVDMRDRPNVFYCVFEWEDTYLANWWEANNAWYVGACDR